ncbi:MAG: IclR family transcriptional regulator domain-containing protein, partial [bacterium]
ISATGRCVAAFSGRPLAELETRFQQLRWDNAPSLRVWRRQVRETGERGYSVDEGHYISGVTVVAAPVLDAARRMTHGVAAVALSDQVRRAGLARLVAGVCQVAGTAAARLRSRESAA